jgi:hypothetical protein
MNPQPTWCILRTGGKNTLPLADELNRAGLATWTPRVLPDPDANARRAPRSRSRRRKNNETELVAALATFIFAPECHLGDLVALSHQGRFSVMTDKIRGRGYALIADKALNPLRALEADSALMKRSLAPVEPFGRGDEIRVPSEGGPYAGMSGIVESSDGKRTWLNFGGIMGRVEIQTFRLRPEEMEEAA